MDHGVTVDYLQLILNGYFLVGGKLLALQT